MKVAEGACYFETVAANGVAMRAACNESHVIARRGHPPAEITSDGARCHDRDPHLALSASKTIICPKTSTLEVSGCRIGSFTSDGHTCRFSANNDRTDASQRIVAQCPTGHGRSVGRPAQAVSFRCMPTQVAALLSGCTGLRSIIAPGLEPPADRS